MAKKTKDELLALLGTLSDSDKADFSSLFADIEERDGRIKKMETEKLEADQIVARSSALQKERDELAKQKGELELKLSGLTGKKTDEIELSAFAPFFSLFK